MPDDAKTRIRTVLASVLGLPADAVSDTSSQETIDTWDSLAHIHLIMGLEAEFGISFDVEQALEMTSVPAIHAALVERAAAPGD
jgi:acyl carrier protein